MVKSKEVLINNKITYFEYDYRIKEWFAKHTEEELNEWINDIKKNSIIDKKQEKELFESYCQCDYKGKHYWESIGCVGLRPIYQVWKCSQCKKIVTEELQSLIKAEPSK